MLAGFRYFPQDRRSLSLRLGLMPDKVWLGISGVEYGWTACQAILVYRRSIGVRFVAILFLLALAGLVGLFIYGQMMEPEVREIEVDANYATQ